MKQLRRLRGSGSGVRTLVLLLLIFASACGDGDNSGAAAGTNSGGDSTTVGGDKRDLSRAVPATFTAHGSVEQLYVTDAETGMGLELIGADGSVLATGTADDQGVLIFRDVQPAAGYAVATDANGVLQASARVTVSAPQDAPDASFYQRQQIGPGYGYLETRDGTLLAINVILPGPVENGPYPTVVEYSGYDPANPDSPQPSTLIAGFLGYAAVGVNMRGTGC